nr:sensor histidine kinase [Alkalibacterium sp. MB6]
MLALFILMLERAGLIIILAYLLVNIPHFQNLLNHRQRMNAKVQLIIVFSLFAIISNFTGVEIFENDIIIEQLFSPLSPGSSLANTRVLTIGVSGLVGGPFVGVFVGGISAIIRYTQGGAEPYIYVVSSLLIGLLSGLFGKQFIRKNQFPNFKEGAIVGVLMEGVQMFSILLLGSQFQNALSLVTFIALPMILINSLGTAMFLSIIESTRRREEQTRAVQTHDVLELANKTLPFFRLGLHEQSTKEAATIIKEFIKVDAVSITNHERILAHVGAASDHHQSGEEIITDLSREVIKSGQTKEAHSHEAIGCQVPGCPLEAAVIIPLYTKDRIVGTLKLYFTDKEALTFVERQLAEGLGNIFSSQLELGQAEEEARLLQDAEIKSLQAQVNPHFFFNALNTISALIRVDSEQARSLLIHLSHFFRANLQGFRTNLIPLHKELHQVTAYLQIEQARFPERVSVQEQIDESLKSVLVPPFLIQVLVENAFKHAFKERKTTNEIVISVCEELNHILISVKDNGAGIVREDKSDLGKTPVTSTEGTGSALENLTKRLVSLFGEEAKLHFESDENGTLVWCRLPKKEDN